MSLGHHHRSGPPPSATAPMREQGAALVEFAMIAMFLLFILGSAFDYGMTWRVTLVANEAARAGARTGSSLDQQPLADWYALTNARASLSSGNQLQNVQRVVIYKSTDVAGTVPPECATASSTTLDCNVLSGAQFRAIAQADFNATTGCINTAKAIAANWCPNERNNVQLTADYYGFWVQTRYNNQFKVAGAGMNVNRDAVMRLEPDVS